MLAPLLTQEEFRAVWSVQLVAHAYGAYGADAMEESAFEETFGLIGSAMVFGVLRLHEAGHQFPAIRVDDDTGELYPVPRAKLTPGNVLYIHQLATGRPINFLEAVQSAIRFIEERNLSMDIEPLRAAESEIRGALEQTRADMPPEHLESIAEQKKHIARTVGRVLGFGDNN